MLKHLLIMCWFMLYNTNEPQLLETPPHNIAQNKNMPPKDIYNISSQLKYYSSQPKNIIAYRDFYRSRKDRGFYIQPFILPEGTNLMGMSIVSPDRRYVRISLRPIFSVVSEVYTFNANK